MIDYSYNTLKAKVTEIQNMQNLNIVHFEQKEEIFSMISLDLENKKVNSNVLLSINPTHVNISKEDNIQISCENKIKAKISHIEEGKLLSYISLCFKDQELQSLISTKKMNDLKLKIKDVVFMYINASDISIKEIL